MNRLLGVVGWIGAALAVAAVAVHVVEDRRTLVSPPDAVAEEFVRQVLTGRSERALPLLCEGVRPGLSRGELDAAGRKLQEELGEVANVSAEIESLSDRRAAASAVLDGARATRTLRFRFVRERGKWMIEEAGGFVPETSPAPAS